MAEPKTLHETQATAPEGALFNIRSALTEELMDLRARTARLLEEIAHAQYGDPSKLGANRGRLTLAGRLLNEVACSVADLAFAARPEDEEAACIGCRITWDRDTRVVAAYHNCPVHGGESRAA